VQDVEPAEMAGRGLDRARDAVGIGDIGRDRDRAIAGEMRALISAIATRAPSRANRIAVARPIPVPAPVISATFPSRRGIGSSYLFSRVRLGLSTLAPLSRLGYPGLTEK
jgi:hypothetical protein